MNSIFAKGKFTKSQRFYISNKHLNEIERDSQHEKLIKKNEKIMQRKNSSKFISEILQKQVRQKSSLQIQRKDIISNYIKLFGPMIAGVFCYIGWRMSLNQQNQYLLKYYDLQRKQIDILN